MRDPSPGPSPPPPSPPRRAGVCYMSTGIYMYHVDIHRHVPPKVEPALARRLEALTGVEASCCVSDYREEAEEIATSDAFQDSLARVKAVADENRLLALAVIKRRGEACGCELQAALDLTHATVSHHMAVLQKAGLVASERRGKWVHYKLTPAATPFV